MPVSLFQPAANPAPNPAGFADAASSIYDALTRAAAQHAQVQQQQTQQSLKDRMDWEFKALKAGFTKVETENAAGQPSLLRGGSNADIPRRSQIMQTPWGEWAAPAPKEAKKSQLSAEQTATTLEKGARPVDAAGNVPQDVNTPRFRVDEQGNMTDTGMFGVNAAPPTGSTVPGASGDLYVPPPDETLASKLRTQAANKPPAAPTIDTEHFNVPVSVDHAKGKVTALDLPPGVTHNDKPEKTSRYTFSYHTDDAGTVHVLRGDPDTGEVTEVKAVKGAGAKRKDPDAPATPKKASPAQLNAIEGRKKAAYIRAEAQYRRDVKDKEDIPEWVTDASKTRRESQQAAQDAYESSLTQFGYPVEHYEVPNGNETAAPPATSKAGAPATASNGQQWPAKPANGAQPGGKMATVDVVRQYAKQKGISEAQAVREFQDYGYRLAR